MGKSNRGSKCSFVPNPPRGWALAPGPFVRHLGALPKISLGNQTGEKPFWGGPSKKAETPGGATRAGQRATLVVLRRGNYWAKDFNPPPGGGKWKPPPRVGHNKRGGVVSPEKRFPQRGGEKNSAAKHKRDSRGSMGTQHFIWGREKKNRRKTRNGQIE